MAVTLMTIAEYARHRGCDEKAVRKALAEGRISRIGTERRCIDPEVAGIQWARNTRARGDSARPPSAGTGDASSAPDRPEGAQRPDGYEDHRARREKADADRAEVLALREAEQVLLREGAERATFDAFRGLRDAAFQAMRDVTPKVRDLTEPREIQLALEAELRAAFANFEETSRRRLADLAAEARR